MLSLYFSISNKQCQQPRGQSLFPPMRSLEAGMDEVAEEGNAGCLREESHDSEVLISNLT